MCPRYPASPSSSGATSSASSNSSKKRKKISTRSSGSSRSASRSTGGRLRHLRNRTRSPRRRNAPRWHTASRTQTDAPQLFVHKFSKHDFVVHEELPAGVPSGTGERLYLLIEKHNLTTPALRRQIAQLCGCPAHYIGIGGRKDKQAFTMQRVSIPRSCYHRVGGPDALAAQISERCMVRDMDRHDEPLRQGGIAGNRFFLRLRNLGEVPNTLFRSAASHAIECVERDGFPNYYGEQRFGLQARNPMIGKKILLDKQLTHRTQLSKKEMGGDYRDEATRKVQSLASFLFNRYIQKRRAANMYTTILEGDVLMSDAGLSIYRPDRPQLSSRPDMITGPVYGDDLMLAYVGKDHATIDATDGIHSLALELATLSDYELTYQHLPLFGQFGLYGRRRVICARWAQMSYRFIKKSADIEITFVLPPGSYATVVFDEMRRLMRRYIASHDDSSPTLPHTKKQ